MSQETVTRWKKHEQKVVDTRTPGQIANDERKTKWDRAAEKVQPVADDMSLKNRFERKAVVRQQQTEGTRNKFGDKGEIVDPRDKQAGAGTTKRFATEWRGQPVERSSTGRPLDAELLDLKQKADADRIKRVQAKERAKLGLPAEEKPLAPKNNSFEDLQAMALYLQAAHPEIPFDVPSTADENLKRVAKQNSNNLANMWRWLVFKGIVKNDLTGLLSAFEQCKSQNAFDDGKRVRGFGNRELIDIIPAPPDAPENSGVNEALDLVRTGQARFSKMRPPTNDESAERARLKAMPFSELKILAKGK